MDISAPEIVFTDTGCSFCDHALRSLEAVKKEAQDGVGDRIVERMKRGANKRQYDCLIGLSGGVDSSFTLHAAKSLGLRPLAFSVDNGWNDPKADANVFNLVEAMNVPFEKVVIDWATFRELQAAFLAAGQKNVEIPTDHVLMAVSLDLAARHGIPYILSGGNVATESIMPESWGYNARDLVHIKAIYKWHTGKKLSGLPTCSLLKWNWYKWVKGVKTIYLLDYFGYDRRLAKQILEKHYKYQDIGEKHEESIFTRWFQNFYLFEKFGIDKRKAHYSSMIVAGAMTREEAMEKLDASPVYPELGLERKVRKYKTRDYREFPTDEKLFKRISAIVKTLKLLTLS